LAFRSGHALINNLSSYQRVKEQDPEQPVK